MKNDECGSSFKNDLCGNIYASHLTTLPFYMLWKRHYRRKHLQPDVGASFFRGGGEAEHAWHSTVTVFLSFDSGAMSDDSAAMFDTSTVLW